MKLLVVYASVLALSLGAIAAARNGMERKFCWCWSGGQHSSGVTPHLEKNEYASYGSYGSEPDWNDPNRTLPLDYNQDQGKRIFYQQCVWCHSDTTPAGPSNRSNVSPDPPLMNDGSILNKESDASLKKIIFLGGSGVGKSAMMPPYGGTLTDEDIDDLIAYIRVIAVPEYKIASMQNANARK
jgi:mono/diheme cytochrome c family protein